MAQIKLELEKEIFIPYKVILQMEAEESTKNAWQEEEENYHGQHWKYNPYNYN